MDYSKMKVLDDKVIIRFSQQSIDDLFSKKIIRDDGTTVKLWINVDAEETDDRKATLFVRTGEVINKGPKATRIKIGDTAILSYEVFNDITKFVSMEGDDKIVWVNANTTYHDRDEWAYGNRTTVKGRDKFTGAPKEFKNDRDQMVAGRGEVDQLSQIIGWISSDIMFANDPYVFLHHEEHEKKIITLSGIQYTDRPKIIERKVLCSSPVSYKKYGIDSGGEVMVKESDTFEVVLGDKKITCVNDVDVMACVKTKKVNKKQLVKH